MAFNANSFFRTNNIYGANHREPPITYHIFVTIPSGWPIIAPANSKEYKIMMEKTHVYDHFGSGSAEQCIQRQLKILKKLIIIPQQPLS